MAGSRVPDVVNAAVDGLVASAALTTLLGGPKAYTHVPAGTNPPYVLVLGGDEIPWVQTFCDPLAQSPGTADDGDTPGRTVDVVAQCYSTFRGSAEADDIADAVVRTLTDDTTWAGVQGFQVAEFLRNLAQQPTDLFGDGVVWFVRIVAVRTSLV